MLIMIMIFYHFCCELKYTNYVHDRNNNNANNNFDEISDKGVMMIHIDNNANDDNNTNKNDYNNIVKHIEKHVSFF